MDFIDRKQAIEKTRPIIDEWLADLPNGPYKVGFILGSDIAIQAICDVPPVRNTGKWIKIDSCNTVQCSECFNDFDYIGGLYYLCHGQELLNYYCPYCGARLKE